MMQMLNTNDSVLLTQDIHLSTAHTYSAYNSYNALQNVSTTDSFRLDPEAAGGSLFKDPPDSDATH